MGTICHSEKKKVKKQTMNIQEQPNILGNNIFRNNLFEEEFYQCQYKLEDFDLCDSCDLIECQYNSEKEDSSILSKSIVSRLSFKSAPECQIRYRPPKMTRKSQFYFDKIKNSQTINSLQKLKKNQTQNPVQATKDRQGM